MRKILLVFALVVSALQARAEGWVRINQLGYLPGATKVAVYMGADAPEEFTLVDAYTGAEELASFTARPVFELRPERLSVEDFIALTNDLA